MAALSTWAPEDGVLSVIAPLALAAARDTALVVDLDPDGPRYQSSSSLADLVRDSPRASDLSPRRRGVAVLRNGGVHPSAARDVVVALVDGWPAVVLRTSDRETAAAFGVRVVPVRPMLPAGWLLDLEGPAVYQPLGVHASHDGRGIVLPRPPRSAIRALVAGSTPGRSSWMRAWRQVWEASWP
jgi:hypothetical protein